MEVNLHGASHLTLPILSSRTWRTQRAGRFSPGTTTRSGPSSTGNGFPSRLSASSTSRSVKAQGDSLEGRLLPMLGNAHAPPRQAREIRRREPQRVLDVSGDGQQGGLRRFLLGIGPPGKQQHQQSEQERKALRAVHPYSLLRIDPKRLRPRFLGSGPLTRTGSPVDDPTSASSKADRRSLGADLHVRGAKRERRIELAKTRSDRSFRFRAECKGKNPLLRLLPRL
jgi:hypothetical protein